MESQIKTKICGKKEPMEWIYLSPHLDDVALSCGGLVWEQTHAGHRVSILTICAGDPPPGPLSPFAESLHARWRTGIEAMAQRRSEDLNSCKILGAFARHFSIPDCIYRHAGQEDTPVCINEESLFDSVHPAETDLILHLSSRLSQTIPQGAEVVCPLTLGGHIDHVLTRTAVENIGRRLWYYADYPYIEKDLDDFVQLKHTGWESQVFTVTNSGLIAWEQSVAAHASQISTFWPDLDTMRADIRVHYQQVEGIRLWRPG